MTNPTTLSTIFTSIQSTGAALQSAIAQAPNLDQEHIAQVAGRMNKMIEGIQFQVRSLNITTPKILRQVAMLEHQLACLSSSLASPLVSPLASTLASHLETSSEPEEADIAEILNRQVESQKTFELLLKALSPETVNLRFFVEEPHVNMATNSKTYTLATREEILAVPSPSYPTKFAPEHNHTTTLANIICTNELRFTPEQVSALVRKLIACKADFSQIDYTVDLDSGWYGSIQNNPLKSLIVAGTLSSHYDMALVELIRHIGTLPNKHQIFDHIDHSPRGNMSPLHYLIRQGKEDIAVVLLDCGIHAQEADLIAACYSFGSTLAKRPEGMNCVKKIRQALIDQHGGISKDCIRQCIEGLLQGTHKEALKHQERLRKDLTWLQEWAACQDERFEQPMPAKLRARMSGVFPEFSSFKAYCKDALKDTKCQGFLSLCYAIEIACGQPLKGGYFDESYRENDGIREKYNWSVNATALYDELIALLEKTPPLGINHG